MIVRYSPANLRVQRAEDDDDAEGDDDVQVDVLFVLFVRSSRLEERRAWFLGWVSL